jgi:hypothetical protein
MDEHMDALNEAKSRLEKVETKLARPGALGWQQYRRADTGSRSLQGRFPELDARPGDPERRTALQQRAKELRRVESKAFGTRMDSNPVPLRLSPRPVPLAASRCRK